MQNNSITIQLIKLSDGGFAIKFPFELKDNFRGFFPSAKWNPADKQWEVGSRSGKRLEQWINEINGSDVIESLNNRDAAELAAEELAKLRAELNALSGKITSSINLINSLEESKAKVVEVKDLIASKQDKLKIVEEQVKCSKQSLQEERKNIKSMLSGIIDFKVIEDAFYKMSNSMVPSQRSCKRIFNDAQGKIAMERKRLLDAGFRCSALEFLATANVNRPDRDHPKFVTDEMWFKIWEDQA